MLSTLLGQFWPYLIAAGAALFGAWRVLASAKKRGRDELLAKQARDKLAARKEADKINDAVAGMTDEEVLREQAKWSRPKR